MSTWTTPATASSGGGITAAFWNTEVRDHLNWLKGALAQANITSDTAKPKITEALFGARVFRSSDQTLTTSVQTPITFDSERFDSDAFHSTVSNTDRIVIPASSGGYYMIGGHVSFAANATGIRQLILTLNGTTGICRSGNVAGTAAGNTELSVTTLYQFAAADFITCDAFQTSGGNLAASAQANWAPEFWIHRFSAT